MQLNSYDDKISEECPLQFDTITGTALLTDRQKTWRNITKQALSLKPIRLKRVPTKPFKVFPLPKYANWLKYCYCITTE